jgi:AsmA protein
MKRLGMPIAAFFGVALFGLFAMSWFLNRDALRAAVEAQIRAVTGLDLVIKGSIDVSVFPGSYVPTSTSPARPVATATGRPSSTPLRAP